MYYEYIGNLHLQQSDLSERLSFTLRLKSYNKHKHGQHNEYVKHHIPILSGDRLTVFDKFGNEVFDEIIVMDKKLRAEERFNYTYLPFFFETTELLFFLKMFEFRPKAILIKGSF